jgi:hypothetical protein
LIAAPIIGGRMMSAIFSAGSPKKCSAPCCSSTSSPRWIVASDCLVMLPYMAERLSVSPAM